MSYEGWIAVGAFVISVIVGVAGFRKTGAETFETYQKALQKAQENYDTLSKRNDELSQRNDEFSARLEALEKKYHLMEIWNRALVGQLINAQLIPISLEEATKKNKTDGYN